MRAGLVPRLLAAGVPARAARRHPERLRHQVRAHAALAAAASRDATAAHGRVRAVGAQPAAAAAAARALLCGALARRREGLRPRLRARLLRHVQGHRRRLRRGARHGQRAARLLLAVRGHRPRWGLLPWLLLRRPKRRPLPRPAARHARRVQHVQPPAVPALRAAVLRVRKPARRAAHLPAAAAHHVLRGLPHLPGVRRGRARPRRRRRGPLRRGAGPGVGAGQAHDQRAHDRPGLARKPPHAAVPRRERR